MSFISEQNNQSSSKFSLVRIEPARWTNDDLADQGDGTYQVTLSGFIVSKVLENGTELTLTTGTPVQGEYSFNDLTGLLTVYPTLAPSATNSIVAFHYLFYTSRRTRSTTEDPEDSTTPTRDWLPRITESPKVNQSIENLQEGWFEIDGSSVNLINNDNEFNRYLNDNSSFKNKEVKIWFCIDSTENIQKAFFGKITEIDLKIRSVSLTVKNNYIALAEPALMGDSKAYCYWNTQDWNDLDPNKASLPILFHFGKASRYKTNLVNRSDLSSFVLNLDEMPEAVCTVYSNLTSTSKNRTWGLGRINGAGLQQNVYSVLTSYHGDAQYTRLTIAESTSIFIGDNGKVLGSGTEWVRVISVDSDNSFVYLDKTSVDSWNSLTINGVSIGIDQLGLPNWYYPFEERDYDINYITTDSNNSLVQVTFKNNFESNLTNMEVLNPSEHLVRYRLKPKFSEVSHGKALQYLLGKVDGLTLNTSTFDGADNQEEMNLVFSIPNFDESDFAEYTKYLGDILQSTFGYLRLNNDFGIDYELISSISSGGTEITDHDIKEDDFRARINYQDIINEIVAYNPHYSSTDHHSFSGGSLSSNKAKHLHGVNKTIRFRHVLESVSTRLQTILNYKSNRKVRYSIDTKQINLNSLVGQNLTLSYLPIDGESTSAVKIMAIDKSPMGTSLVLDDFIGV